VEPRGEAPMNGAVAVPYSPSLPTTSAPARRSRLSLRALAVDAAVAAAAVAVFLAPGRLHHAPSAQVTDFGGTVSAAVAPARIPTADRGSRVRYSVQQIPCAAGQGRLTCWTTAPAT
jgi:hypothetical protein